MKRWHRRFGFFYCREFSAMADRVCLSRGRGQHCNWSFNLSTPAPTTSNGEGSDA